jgi:hypothetical protein
MKGVQAACLSLIACLALSGCQTSQARKDQLATICADPNNRQPNTFYYDECQTLYPSTTQQRQRDYGQNAPVGDD